MVVEVDAVHSILLEYKNRDVDIFKYSVFGEGSSPASYIFECFHCLTV